MTRIREEEEACLQSSSSVLCLMKCIREEEEDWQSMWCFDFNPCLWALSYICNTSVVYIFLVQYLWQEYTLMCIWFWAHWEEHRALLQWMCETYLWREPKPRWL